MSASSPQDSAEKARMEASTGNNSSDGGSNPNEPFTFRKSESGGSGSSHHSTSGLLGLGGPFGFQFDSDAMMRSNHGNSSDDSGEKASSAAASAKQQADNNVANLQSLARAHMPVAAPSTASVARKREEEHTHDTSGSASNNSLAEYHRYPAADNESMDEEDDDDASQMSCSTTGVTSTGQPRKKKKKLAENKRVKRNAREKERSFRISKQINELRGLLGSGGVIVPKGTKSSVLTEAAHYIRMLQQHQYRSEIDRHQLIQQMQLIGGGAHGAQAAQAIRHVAAKNGVWSLGNFGGVPPKAALTKSTSGDTAASSSDEKSESPDSSVNGSDYRFIFNSCGVGMAIASMGGAYIDCNQLFCQLSNYDKQEICSLTIFNMTARQDLQHAFDLISQLISPPMEGPAHKHIAVRGSFKSRSDLGLCVNLVKGSDGIAKCFCVTIIKNPLSPFDTEAPVPVSFESILSKEAVAKGPTVGAAPAFTSG